MKSEDHNSSFVQCQYCGYVYIIETEEEIPTDALIIEAWCPQCGSYHGLNCGKYENDIYEFMNVNVDERYYRY